MKRNYFFIFGVSLMVIIFISGCSYKTPLLKVPPKMISPMEPQILSVYGTLIDFYTSKGYGIFKIESEIVNYELNNTLIEVKTNLTDINIVAGNKYVLKFFNKINEKQDYWTRVIISQNLEEYKQKGALFHEYDLYRNQSILTEQLEGTPQGGVSEAVKIIPVIMMPNHEVKTKIKIMNKQDVDIPIKISNLRLVDEYIWEPYLYQCLEGENRIQLPSVSGAEVVPPIKAQKSCSEKSSEERLQESILTNCKITTNSSEITIPRDSSKEVEFSILCNEPISCKNWYIYGNVTTDCSLILIGDFEFIDELGNIHKEENYYLKQSITAKNN